MYKHVSALNVNLHKTRLTFFFTTLIKQVFTADCFFRLKKSRIKVTIFLFFLFFFLSFLNSLQIKIFFYLIIHHLKLNHTYIYTYKSYKYIKWVNQIIQFLEGNLYFSEYLPPFNSNSISHDLHVFFRDFFFFFFFIRRKRKASSKSSTKSNKRKASTTSSPLSSSTDAIVKQEPIITTSPVSLPKNLESPTAEISQYTSSSNDDDLQRPTRLTLETPISKINLTDVPNEIFVQICANLPPSDLLSLTLVCKKLKSLLCSPGSKETQAIWRTSRIRFMRFLQSPPPHNMDEKSYIVLKQDKGCQFCNEKNFVKVYWEFRVRCCDLCLDEHTMR
jgi:hypothetical protein